MAKRTMAVCLETTYMNLRLFRSLLTAAVSLTLAVNACGTGENTLDQPADSQDSVGQAGQHLCPAAPVNAVTLIHKFVADETRMVTNQFGEHNLYLEWYYQFPVEMLDMEVLLLRLPFVPWNVEYVTVEMGWDETNWVEVSSVGPTTVDGDTYEMYPQTAAPPETNRHWRVSLWARPMSYPLLVDLLRQMSCL